MKTVLDVLDLDFVFSQQEPLRVAEFIKECKRRSVDVERAHLDALHAAGILVPFYRVARNMRGVWAWMRQQDRFALPSEAPAGHVLTDAGELCADRDSGRVYDPLAELHRPWYHYERIMGTYPIVDAERPPIPIKMQASEFLYSHYQLMALAPLPPVIARMRPRRRGARQLLVIDPDDVRLARAYNHLAFDRGLHVGLSAIEARYRPEIVGHLWSHRGITDEPWRTYCRDFEPVEMLSWLGWSAEQVLALAASLLHEGRDLDPLADWADLVRLCDPGKWSELRGMALVALDYRIAAEMLLRFYEDLVRMGAATPLPALPDLQRYDWNSFEDRLQPARQQLDRTITAYGLSPHPWVVLVLEGETEMLLAPRVMELLGIPPSPTTIRIENAQTIDRDLSMLASYVATPVVGETHGDVVAVLDRPLTRFLVAVDPEKGYKTEGQREQKRSNLVNKIVAALPQEQRTPAIVAQVNCLVHVDAWGTESFEYAHFSDEELARAVNEIYAGYHPSDDAALCITAAEVAEWRARAGNLAKIITGVELPKPALAEALWPILEWHIEEARLDDAIDQIPVVRVVRHALELARVSRRQRAIDLRSRE